MKKLSRGDTIKSLEIESVDSSRKTMLRHLPDVPFPLIADPDKIQYKEFGVETSLFPVIQPRALPHVMHMTTVVGG